MAIGPSKGPAVLANGFEPATAPFVVRLMDGTVSLQCQAHQQLRAAQIRPAMGSVVQRVGEVISLGHEMPRASGGHRASVAPTSARDTPWFNPTSADCRSPHTARADCHIWMSAGKICRVERLLQLEAEDWLHWPLAGGPARRTARVPVDVGSADVVAAGRFRLPEPAAHEWLPIRPSQPLSVAAILPW